MITDKEKREFGRMKAGYSNARKIKQSNGSLWLDGYLHLYNLPFPILQTEKKRLMGIGYNSNRIKIGYFNEERKYTKQTEKIYRK